MTNPSIPLVEVAGSVPPEVDALVVGLPSDRLGQALSATDAGVGPEDLAAVGFEGEPGQLAALPSAGGPDWIFVGVGPRKAIDNAVLRRAAAVAARSASRRASIALTLASLVPVAERPAAVEAIAEGVCLGSYRFERYKSSPTNVVLARAVVVSPSPSKLRDSAVRGVRIAEAQALARDLVNTPGGELTPELFAQAAVEVAEREDLKISVLDEDDIVEQRLGGLLGVNRGSTHPARFIELCFEPAGRPSGSLALVGKGITFDSGGLSIKTGEGMMTMKDDMGGAAAVLGAFSGLTAVSPSCRVTGYLPLTDNMSGGDATRPGDVLEIRNGKTVEVLNTDAEGRLVLADALSLASEAKPDAIVDLATLTGAVEVALGGRIAGLMGNDERWVAQVEAAATQAGERVWPLPLPEDYLVDMRSEVADLRNISKRSRSAGTITAGLFLREFVAEGIPWAHLDIAGTAWWGDADEGEFAKGGTGWGVRTLLELAAGFSSRSVRRR